MATQDDNTIQLAEERIAIDTKRVVTARVRVTTSSDTIEDIARASLSGERVEITRERLDRQIDAVPHPRHEGDTTIIPVVEEIAVVETRLILVEEIRIRRIATTEEVAVPITLRKQTATIERIEDQTKEETP